MIYLLAALAELRETPISKRPRFTSICTLALAIAIAHLLLFRYLDGREADGPNRVAPQAYITTASNILANAFGFALRASLAVAFCQYLWRLFRAQAMKVSTIELIYSIRTNPFQLFQLAVLRAAPTLCALATIMWLSQIASSFPPGAITITTAQRVEFSSVIVPNFNASYVSPYQPFSVYQMETSNNSLAKMGNGSGAEANANSLFRLVISETATGFVSG